MGTCGDVSDAPCLSCGGLQNPSANSTVSNLSIAIKDVALSTSRRWLPWLGAYAGLSAASLLARTVRLYRS